MLRSNDLIWSFVVNNYLLGQGPAARSTCCYWNSDATRMPAAMHIFYLRNMYQREPAGAAGRAHDRRRADRPRQGQDADLPAGRARTTTSRRTGRSSRRRKLFYGPGALHAGGLGPHRRRRQSARRRRSTSTGPTTASRASRRSRSGSPTRRSTPARGGRTGTSGCRASPARKVPARVPGIGGLPAIEDAPGCYVKVRS